MYRVRAVLLGVSFCTFYGAMSASVSFGAQKPTKQEADYSDLCHVYVVDTELAEKMTEEFLNLPGDATAPQISALKEKYKDSERILGEFSAKVGEEQLTTRTYSLGETGPYITASVYYTDEMMASTGHSDSIVLAIVVSAKKYDNAMAAEKNAVSQASYSWDTDKLQVKTNTRVNGRLLLVGLECQARIGTLHPEIHGPDVIFGERRKKKQGQ